MATTIPRLTHLGLARLANDSPDDRLEIIDGAPDLVASIQALALGGDRYEEVPIGGGIARSPVPPGFSVAVADLFASA